MQSFISIFLVDLSEIVDLSKYVLLWEREKVCQVSKVAEEAYSIIFMPERHRSVSYINSFMRHHIVMMAEPGIVSPQMKCHSDTFCQMFQQFEVILMIQFISW